MVSLEDLLFRVEVGMDSKRQKELLSLKTKSRIFDDRKSYIKKYQEIAVGNESLLSLLKYEFTITTFGWIPGALGIVLRKYFYAHLFKPKLENVIFGKNVDLFNPSKIKIGTKCVIGDNCLIEAKTCGSISIGDNVSIGRGSLIRCGSGFIEIGDNTSVAAYCHIAAIGTKVRLGQNVAMAAYGYIIGHGGYGSSSIDEPMINNPVSGRGIVIEDNVWLGGGIHIIDGNNIGTGSIIGAGSVVTQDIPEYSIAVGVPARVVKRRI